MKRTLIALLISLILVSTSWAFPVSPGITIQENDGSPSKKVRTIKVDNNALSISGNVATVDLSGAAGGQAITLDIGDDAGDDSVDLGEIATTGDTNSIFTESAPDKLLIDLGNNWPTADEANAGDSATAFFDAGTIEHEYGGLEADVSAYTGLIGITAGATAEVDTAAELETYAGLGAFANEYLDDADAATMRATLGVTATADDVIQTTNFGGDVSGTYDAIQVDESGVDHDSLANFAANEHIDWTSDQGATDIDIGNIPTAISTELDFSVDIVFSERADHSSTPGAGKGYLWVKSTAPSTLIFTDDTGADTTLGAGGSSNVEDDVYGAGWNADTTNAPSQNAVYDILHQYDTDDDGDIDNLDAALGGGTVTTVELDGVVVDATVTVIDFETDDFDATESPEDEILIELDSEVPHLNVAETITANWDNTANPWDVSSETNLAVDANELTLTGDSLGLADHATARAALGLAIGTDVQAYDADLTTYAGITPSANVQSLLGAADYAAMRTLLDLEAGTDFYSISAADTAFEGELDNEAGLYAALSDVSLFLEDLSDDTSPSLGGNLAVGAYEIQSTTNVVVQLGDNAGSYVFEVEDSDGTTIWQIDSDGGLAQIAVADPYVFFNDNDMATEFAIQSIDTATDRLAFGTTTDEMATAMTQLGYMDANHLHYDGNMNITTGHTYQINDTQINIGNLAAGGNWTPTGSINLDSATLTLDGDHLDIDWTPSEYTPADTPAEAADADDLTAHLYGIDQYLAGISAGSLASLSDTADVDYTGGTILIGDDTDSFDEKVVSGHATLSSAGAVTVVDFATNVPAVIGEDLDINFNENDELVTLTSTANNYAAGAGIVTIYDDSTGQTSASYLLRLAREADGDAQDHFILFEDNSTGAAANGDDMFYVNSGGVVYAAGVVTSAGFTIGSAAILEAELEIIDGATLGTDDINIIDGISDSGSLTAAELLYVDGVTSAIQTQLDAKEGTLTDKASLESTISDVSDFAEADGDVYTGTHDFGGADDLEIPNSASDMTIDTAGQIGFELTDDQLVLHGGAAGEAQGEYAMSTLEHVAVTVDPGTWYDSDAEIFLFTVGDDFPEGITIVEWSLSCNVDPDVEIAGDLKYADAWIGLANAAVIDVLDTTAGVSSEDTAANINGGAAIANGKVLYFSFDSDPEGTCVQMSLEFWAYAEAD